MGRIMKEDDIFIPQLLNLLNLRFAPAQGSAEAFGGIEEMAELQKEFQIFRPGRALRDCVALLNLGGWNARARNRWLLLIDGLTTTASDIEGVNGNDRIMNMLSENLSSRNPLPVLFQAHDSRVEPGNKVVVTSAPAGLFFMERPHIIVSVPMRPRQMRGTAARATAAKRAPATRSRASSKTTRKAPKSTRKTTRRR